MNFARGAYVNDHFTRYLKGMPIKEISEVVDYFVYMTYDLHGQWDYGNKWYVVQK
jgi:GH18 family chitinase